MKISGKTKLIGLIGWPVSHSFSPEMHNTAADALGLDFAYIPMPVSPDSLETAIRGLPALGFQGVNVTVPHKQAVIPFLDEMDVDAQAIGAVNTIVIEQETKGPWLIGYNTDTSGFLADLVNLNVDVDQRDCLILGAGGAARAVAYALVTTGGRVQILARRVEQAKQLVKRLAPYLPTSRLHFHPTGARLSARPLTELKESISLSSTPLIINTTPVGMAPDSDQSIWPDEIPFPKDSFIYDLVYNPTQTKLMRQADSAGCHSANGLGMLIQQGALAFQLWTGQMPDIEIMSKVLE